MEEKPKKLKPRLAWALILPSKGKIDPMHIYEQRDCILEKGEYYVRVKIEPVEK